MKSSTTVANHNLTTQEIMAEAKNYNYWIFQLIRPFLGLRILDIGCSIGNITQYFMDRECVVGIDSDVKSVEQIQQRFISNQNFHPYYSDFPKSDISHLRKFSLDTVTCLNVLEHIDDDINALVTMNNSTHRQWPTRLTCASPAMALRQHGRCRRPFSPYSARELREKLSTAGVSCEQTSVQEPPGDYRVVHQRSHQKSPLYSQKSARRLSTKSFPWFSGLSSPSVFPLDSLY